MRHMQLLAVNMLRHSRPLTVQEHAYLPLVSFNRAHDSSPGVLWVIYTDSDCPMPVCVVWHLEHAVCILQA